MEHIYIGKIVNTHALKGEIKILSDFEYKAQIFRISNTILVGESKEELEIETYRKHKNFDMIKFKGINDIDAVLKYKGKAVYYLKEKLILKENEYLDTDIIGLNAYYNEENIGKIDNIEYRGKNRLLIINKNLIPYHDNFIKEIDVKNKKIILKNLEGLI